MENKVNLIWTFYGDALEEFLNRCVAVGAETEEERTEILFELLAEGKIESLVQTERSKDKIIEDLKKNFNVADFT